MSERRLSPPGVGAHPSGTGLHIESLKVRLSAQDAASGRRFASGLSAALAEQLAPVVAGRAANPLGIEALNVSLRSSSSGDPARSAASSIARAVARAGQQQSAARRK